MGRIAVVGSGINGLVAGHALLKQGHDVTLIFEGSAQDWLDKVPPQCPDMIDFEGEFTFVFGRTCHNAAPEDALSYVGGYTICIGCHRRYLAENLR